MSRGDNISALKSVLRSPPVTTKNQSVKVLYHLSLFLQVISDACFYIYPYEYDSILRSCANLVSFFFFKGLRKFSALLFFIPPYQQFSNEDFCNFNLIQVVTFL